MQAAVAHRTNSRAEKVTRNENFAAVFSTFSSTADRLLHSRIKTCICGTHTLTNTRMQFVLICTLFPVSRSDNSHSKSLLHSFRVLFPFSFSSNTCSHSLASHSRKKRQTECTVDSLLLTDIHVTSVGKLRNANCKLEMCSLQTRIMRTPKDCEQWTTSSQLARQFIASTV